VKHSEMCNLMGQVVTVRQQLCARRQGIQKRWLSEKVPERAGWVVGFTIRMDGQIEQGGDFYKPPYFRETKRTPCLLVAYWPTVKPVPVPLDGYELGGTPTPPDFGGWRGINEEALQRYKRELRDDMIRWPRDKKGRWLKQTPVLGSQT